MFSSTTDIDWPRVCSQVSELIWELARKDIEALAQPFARFVMTSKGEVGMYFDYRAEGSVLGPGQVAYAFVRQNQEALEKWVGDMKDAVTSPEFQRIATAQFAQSIVRLLRAQAPTNTKKSNPWIVAVVGVCAFYGGGQLIRYIYTPVAAPQQVAAMETSEPAVPVFFNAPAAQSSAESFIDSTPQAAAVPAPSRVVPPRVPAARYEPAPAFDANTLKELEAVSERAVQDFPFLDTPAGAEVLGKIVARRDLYISRGTHPSLALQRAINDFSYEAAPAAQRQAVARPAEPPPPVPTTGCRWVTPQQWSCVDKPQ